MIKKNPKILAVIPAKGTSKRFKNKNIAMVWEKPMIYWAISACKNAKNKIDVWVNTDSKLVEDIVLNFDVKLHRREEDLLDPEIYKMKIVRNTVKYVIDNYYNPDIVISLQPNSPQITSKDLDNAISMLNQYDLNEVFSVNKDFIQNGAFRILKGPSIFQKDLSTYCGVFICDLVDIHYKEDIKLIGENNEDYS